MEEREKITQPSSNFAIENRKIPVNEHVDRKIGLYQM